MDRVERLSRRQEEALQEAAERFVDSNDGDLMKALKCMMLLNKDLQERVDAMLSTAPPRTSSPRPKRPLQSQFTF
jgi:hypothetical protein